MKLIDIDKIKEIMDFDAGVYYLILMARRKNNDDLSHSKEIVIRRVLYKEEMLEIMINELVAIADYDKEHKYKLYLSFNPRDVLKAYKDLKTKMATYDYELLHNTEINKKILKLDMEWISCLARNSAKKKFFMLDLDDRLKLSDITNLMRKYLNITPNLWESYGTRNGYHILFKPCDTRELMENIKNCGIDCELKRDELLCIGYDE